MWKFLVKNQSIEILEREVLADHQIRYVQFKFTFDGDWKKFHKVVQFSQCDEVFSIVLGIDDTSCYLPSELHAGAVKMSVFGYDTASDSTMRATTVPVTLNIRESGFEGDDTPIPPTPDLYTQLLKKIAEIQAGVDGKDGLSAYEIAKENGFVGTISEWLESLKGTPGKDGRDGIDGRDGVDGVSPDMSQYPPTSAVELMIQKVTEPLSLKSHEHENSSILDGTTASYTLEEQRKLAEIDPSEYATKADYPPTSAVELMIQKVTEPLSLKSHEHQNSSVLDGTTASYTLEEQRKLAEVQPSDYATKERLNEEILSVREAMIPLTRELHSHKNKAVIDSITAENMAILGDLQQFEDSVQYDIQTINEELLTLNSQRHTHGNKGVLDGITREMLDDMASISTVVGQAHWHHNLTTLNSITESHISRWNEAYTAAMNLNERVGVNEGVFERFKTEILYDMQGAKKSITEIFNRLTVIENALTGVESALADIVEVTT